MADRKLIFRFPPFLRWLSIIVALLALAWAVYFITSDISAVDQWYKKAAPFLVLFLVINVLYKNLFTINSIRFTDSSVFFKPLLLKGFEIKFSQMKRLEFRMKGGKSIVLSYNENDTERTLIIPRGIEKIVIVLSLIAEQAPNLELDEFMKTVITTKR